MSNIDPKLNIVVLGTASIARKNIRAILQTSTLTVSCVASRNPSKAVTYCMEVGLPPTTVTCTYDEALSLPSIDAVYIPLPTTLHLQWVRKAAEKGKHILCEKPVGVTASEIREIAGIAESYGVVVMVSQSKEVRDNSRPLS